MMTILCTWQQKLIEKESRTKSPVFSLPSLSTRVPHCSQLLRGQKTDWRHPQEQGSKGSLIILWGKAMKSRHQSGEMQNTFKETKQLPGLWEETLSWSNILTYLREKMFQSPGAVGQAGRLRKRRTLEANAKAIRRTPCDPPSVR